MGEETRKTVAIVGPTGHNSFGMHDLHERAYELMEKISTDTEQLVQGPPSRQQRRHERFQVNCLRFKNLGDTRKKRRELARKHGNKANKRAREIT